MFVNGVTEIDGKIYIHGSEENLEKFAELIVKECRDIVEQDMKLAHIQMIPLTLEKYANGRLKEKIREHFGVEE
jgi:hypothetical protein